MSDQIMHVVSRREQEYIAAAQQCDAFGGYYKAREEIILRAWRAGVRKTHIANRMGLSRSTIENIITRKRDNGEIHPQTGPYIVRTYRDVRRVVGSDPGDSISDES